MAYILQATEKARALLDKQCHKTQIYRQWIRKMFRLFILHSMLEYSNLLEHYYYFLSKVILLIYWRDDSIQKKKFIFNFMKKSMEKVF